MVCSNCGSTIPDGSTTCPNCNTAVGGATATATATAPPVAAPAGAATTSSSGGAKVYLDYARDAGLQAWSALRRLALDPVGGLDSAYTAIGDAGALRVGIIFGIFSVFAFMLGGYLFLKSIMESIQAMFGGMGTTSGLDMDFGSFVKLVIFAATPFVCATACSIGVRKGLGSRGGIGGDCFIVGTAMLPLSLWAILGGMFGVQHYNIVSVLTVFAMCIGILILFTGYTRIDNVAIPAATYLVPTVIIVSLWLAGKIGESIMSDGATSSRSGPPPMMMRGPRNTNSAPDTSMDDLFKDLERAQRRSR